MLDFGEFQALPPVFFPGIKSTCSFGPRLWTDAPPLGASPRRLLRPAAYARASRSHPASPGLRPRASAHPISRPPQAGAQQVPPKKTARPNTVNTPRPQRIRLRRCSGETVRRGLSPPSTLRLRLRSELDPHETYGFPLRVPPSLAPTAQRGLSKEGFEQFGDGPAGKKPGLGWPDRATAEFRTLGKALASRTFKKRLKTS